MSAAPRRRRTTGALVAALTCLLGLAIAVPAFSASTIAAPSFTATPPAATSSQSATFAWTGPAGATFQCSLDGAVYAACTTPRTLSGLTERSHSFAVKAVTKQGTSDATTYSWVVDRTAPAAPVLTTKPTDPTNTATNDFAWTGPADAVSYECSLENGSFAACTSPKRWVITDTNYGQHQFAVRALDAAGNVSTATAYSFKYEKKLPTSGVPFQITGTVPALPIGVPRPIAVTLTNPNSVPIFVNTVNVAVTASPADCDAATNLRITQTDVSPTRTVTVPANSSLTLAAAGRTAPTLELKNLPVNQDTCKSAKFTLGYSGTATN